MKLYKFRSLGNLKYTGDIVLNNRLFAADFLSLNDPMEGIFWHAEYIDKNILEQIKSTKKKIKICSMSAETAFNDPLMWAHYADSFKGVCLEFEVDISIATVKEMEYSDEALKLILDQRVIDIELGELVTVAVQLLSKKYSVWKYENEYRIFSDEEYIDAGIELKKVYLGSRISDENRQIIEKLIPCDIDIVDTDLDGNGKVIAKLE